MRKVNNKWLISALLSLGLAWDYQARVAINSVFPMLRRDLGMTDLQIGLTATAFLWIYALLSPLAGYLGDRFSRRTVLLASITSWNVVTILSGLATSSWHLIALRTLVATAQVCYMPTALAFLTDFHDKKTQGKGIGVYLAGGYVGIFLAGFPAAYVATHLGWRMMFFLAGGTGLLCAALLFILPSDESESVAGRQDQIGLPARTSVRTAAAIFRKRSMLNIMLSYALWSGASWVVITYLPLLIYEHYHLSLEMAAFQATFYMQLSGFVSEPVLGHLSDIWSAGNAKNRYYFCAWGALLGLPALAAIGLGRHTGILITGMLMFGMVTAVSDVNYMPMLTIITTKYQRATAWGYVNFSGCLAGGTSAMLAALTMKRLGLPFVFASCGGLFVLVFLALMVTVRVTLSRDYVADTAEEPTALATVVSKT
jgi:predicted MFS family arabinose efflux permease